MNNNVQMGSHSASTCTQRAPHQSALKIQSFFRGQQVRNIERNAVVTKGMKRKILDHMRQIHDRIRMSDSACRDNDKFIDTPGYFCPELVPKEMQQRHEAQKESLVHVNDDQFFLFKLVRDLNLREKFSLEENAENSLKMLQIMCESRSMTCDFLALYTTIILKNEASLPQAVRDQLYVCKCEGHVFVSIGDPQNESSQIIDPWINYLILPPTSGHRKEFSDFFMRDRGFLGTVKEFKEFLREHPNQYIQNYSDSMEISIEHSYTKITNGITPSQIHTGQTGSLSQFLEKKIFAINDKETFVELLKVALGDDDHSVLELMLKHPFISCISPHQAILSNETEIAILLLLKKKGCINQQDENGNTPLHLAIQTRNSSLFEFLLKNPMCELNIKNNLGETPLYLTIAQENFSNFIQLLYNPRCNSINEPDLAGNTPLHRAVCRSHSYFNFEEHLLKNELCDMNFANVDGNCPMHLAALSGNEAAIELMFFTYSAKCRNYNPQNKDGKTPMHLAIEHSKKEVIYKLADCIGITIREPSDHFGNTPLSLAESVYQNDQDLIDLLILNSD